MITEVDVAAVRKVITGSPQRREWKNSKVLDDAVAIQKEFQDLQFSLAPLEVT